MGPLVPITLALPFPCRPYLLTVLFPLSFHSALRFWVRRRQQRRRDPSSDTLHIAIRNATRVASRSRRRQGHRRDQYKFPPQRRSLSRPHIPCVRLEHSLEGLRKSLLTVDSHTVAGLVTRPWVATVHTSEGLRRDEGSPSRNTHPPQSDDQAAQLLHLIPQLDQSQIQTLMAALKGKAASSPSPRAGASRPAAATSGPHVTMGRADNTPIRPRTIRFMPFESEHYIPRESRPRSHPYQPCYSPHHPEPRARPTSRASSIYAQPSAEPDMMSEWASIKKELQELRKQVNPRQHHDVHMPNFNGLWVPSPSELPKYRKYNGSGNPYAHIKDFIYESSPYQHDRRLMAYLFRRSLDGHALDWFYSLLAEDAEDFAVVKAKFLEQFQDRVGPEYSLTDLIAEKMKPDEDFSAYADRWRQMATRVLGYLPEGEKVKIIIANATPAYRNILAMNDISNMHQLYSWARFIQTQLKDSPIHSMFEPQKSRFQRKPQGPITEGVQVNEQVSAFNPTGQSQNRQYNAQGQNLTNPPQG
ncbi:hypothetical protein Taro_020630 [Colocasia esculenta]|uniref:Retrotransposon gag domain-containing protein n=1 Tax=Colocasia esculenta TaxID=4460 RepID=A0A843UP67_COLES|nr:hypothetical protein [Colocasia esculenta]